MEMYWLDILLVIESVVQFVMIFVFSLVVVLMLVLVLVCVAGINIIFMAVIASISMVKCVMDGMFVIVNGLNIVL